MYRGSPPCVFDAHLAMESASVLLGTDSRRFVPTPTEGSDYLHAGLGAIAGSPNAIPPGADQEFLTMNEWLSRWIVAPST
ncbi:hypothetical protein CBM2606_A10146 [Cupriavidus taiwanensis]|nr:hypothetical protein CBM2606_A10146 [Cupriavidus taiwanensis]